jgi:hypothetical protein
MFKNGGKWLVLAQAQDGGSAQCNNIKNKMAGNSYGWPRPKMAAARNVKILKK